MSSGGCDESGRLAVVRREPPTVGIMTQTSRDLQREQTRIRLLDATLVCLVEYGYAGTTTQRIQDKAGVSRGALLHHFPSKSGLLVAAIHRHADQRLQSIKQVALSLESSTDPLRHIVEVIRDQMAGPPFQAALELWAAARTDLDMREALRPRERHLGAEVRSLFLAHAGIADREVAMLAYESLMAMFRGFEVTRPLRSHADVAGPAVEMWLDYVRTLTRS